MSSIRKDHKKMQRQALEQKTKKPRSQYQIMKDTQQMQQRAYHIDPFNTVTFVNKVRTDNLPGERVVPAASTSKVIKKEKSEAYKYHFD